VEASSTPTIRRLLAVLMATAGICALGSIIGWLTGKIPLAKRGKR
jgi:hypothetical protein